MNKNALTEQRRETVIGLLKNMNIKKSTVGGFDKDDVYECMQKLCDLYENNIEELENAYEAEISELKEKYQKYDDNNDLYVSLIMEAKKSSNEIINQAKTEVETILTEGREQVARQEKELEQMRNGMEAEKDAITTELNASREAVEAEKAAMRAEVAAEKEKAEALKNKYRQQLNSMKEEFAEIKTNILRTAGKVDSLKSKLSDDEAVTWSVTEDLDAVDFPVAGDDIEEITLPDYTADDAADVQTEAAAPEVLYAEPVEEAHNEPAKPFVVDSPFTSEPVYEEPVAAPVVETETVAEQTSELRLEDLIPEQDPIAAAENTAQGMDFNTVNMGMPEAAAAPLPDGEDSGEISFEVGRLRGQHILEYRLIGYGRVKRKDTKRRRSDRDRGGQGRQFPQSYARC